MSVVRSALLTKKTSTFSVKDLRKTLSQYVMSDGKTVWLHKCKKKFYKRITLTGVLHRIRYKTNPHSAPTEGIEVFEGSKRDLPPSWRRNASRGGWLKSARQVLVDFYSLFHLLNRWTSIFLMEFWADLLADHGPDYADYQRHKP